MRALYSMGALQRVFAYPGTSELALCAATLTVSNRPPINSRGDKEAVFFAAGASVIEPVSATAIVHGARGLTNSLGALADVRRNEIGTVVIVGMPATTSARFLPPHGEPALLEKAGAFAKLATEITACQLRESPWHAAWRLQATVSSAVATAATPPCGPVLIGVPQDVAEEAWLPSDAIRCSNESHGGCQLASKPVMPLAYEDVMRHALRPVILMDDYFLRMEGAEAVLDKMSRALDAPVFQVPHSRGPMLFQRTSPRHVPGYLGPLDLDNSIHRRLFGATDLLIILEGRNAYPRVTGRLPGCRKLVLTSCAAAAYKNEYLAPGDVLIEGDPIALAEHVVQRTGRIRRAKSNAGPTANWRSASQRHEAPGFSAGTSLVRSIAQALSRMTAPVIVDDGQMLGGLVARHYDLLPSRVRVIGDHGGFVGSGAAYAVGLSLAQPRLSVLCLLGEQGFTNGFQAFVAAGDLEVNVVFLLCNNGGSVSLEKQSRMDGFCDLADSSFLHNGSTTRYLDLAIACGLSGVAVDWTRADTSPTGTRLEDHIVAGFSRQRPLLIELRCEGLGAFWEGVWEAKGREAQTTDDPERSKIGEGPNTPPTGQGCS